jgi:hypothetical protein
METNWNLYITGVGEYDAVSELLTNFVGQLRDQGLTVTNVQAIGGTLHPDLTNLDNDEDGWTFFAYGEGDVTRAYDQLPMFLRQLKNNRIQVRQHGIVQGSMREIPIPA